MTAVAMKRLFRMLATAAALSSAPLFSQAFAQVDGPLVIRVDAEASIGRIKPLRGVNGAPDMTFLPAPSLPARMGPARNVSFHYREAGVNLVRTHDSRGAADLDPHLGARLTGPTPWGSPAEEHAIDLNVIFPNPAADPADPASYNFRPTDRLIDAIHAIDAETLFRLGRSGMSNVAAPADPARYGEIIRHVVLHYNRGWANGYRNRVRYWEVWNEPDLGHLFWTGTPDQYYALYAAAARAVKAADPAAQVGGPAIALVNEPSPYREGFLDYVRAHRLPLDFFAWHWYSADAHDPYDFSRIAGQMRSLLDRYGLAHTRSFLDEWNYFLHDPTPAPEAHRAAFVASARIYMQDAPIDAEAFYRADRDLRDPPTKVGQALIATGRFGRTPVRLRASGADTQGLAVLAGRSEDRRLVQVLVSNYEIPAALRGPRTGPDILHVPGLFDLALPPRRTVHYPPRGPYRLQVAGLGSGTWRLDHYRIDERNDLGLIDSRSVSGPMAVIAGNLAAPMVDLFVLTRDPSMPRRR